MRDVDAALDELQRLVDRPPRPPAPVGRVVERARRRRRSRRAAWAGGLVAVVAVVVGAIAWAVPAGDRGRTVVAGPGPSTPSTEPAPSAEPEPGDPAVWVVDGDAAPSPASSSFTALVSRLRCSGGTTGRILRPGVVVTHTEVIVRFTAEALGPGAFTCQGNDWVPYRVDIGQPIGNRTLVEGGCAPGGAAEGHGLPQQRVRRRRPLESPGRRLPIRGAVADRALVARESPAF